MSFNPFKKKNSAAEAADALAVETGVSPGALDMSQFPQPQSDDRTDPLADAHIAPASRLLREGPGGRVEEVALGGDSFLRLTLLDASRADVLRPLLLDLPEQTTGFRDLLVAEDSALAAAFDLAEHSLVDIADVAFAYRSIEIIHALTSIAALFVATAQHGLVWPNPSAGLIGLTSEQAHRAAGFQRWRATFSGWDQLAAGEEAQATRELAKMFIAPLDALLTQSQQSGFRHAQLPLVQLLGQLEVLAQSAASYADVAGAFASTATPTLYAATDTGKRREHNEDAYAMLTLDQVSVAGARFTLAAVADGMGGHNSGEIASSLALDLLRTQLSQLALAPRTKHAAPALGMQLEQIIPAIGRALNERAAMDAALGGMGTTLAGYAQLTPQTTLKDAGDLPDAQGAIFWVGDSRVYLLSASGMLPLSVDHSYVQSLVDDGQVTRDEAFTHPQKNIITRCLGASGRDDRPEVAPFMLGPGEMILLCSDGLTDALREEEVWRVVCGVDSAEPAVIASALIDAANAAGGPDNITVALITL
ncbi:MAG: protein phosphatase 2C domain-containing protein [bacterium]|nr:protein phosphatase 2C domain-containing protein [bacterium]